MEAVERIFRREGYLAKVRPFSKVRDNFPQYLLTLDPLPLERDGVTHFNLMELMASDGDL